MALLRHVQEALGGAEKLINVNNFMRVYVEHYEKFGGKQGKLPRITEYWCMDGQTRVEASRLGKHFASYFNGRDSGWVASGHKVAALKPSAVEQAKKEAFNYDFLNTILADRRPNRSITLTAPGTLQIVDLDGNVATLYVNQESGMPEKRTSQFIGKDYVTAPIEDRFSDWRMVDSLRLPFRLLSFQHGERVRDVYVSEWRLNTNLDCGGLAKKP